ncbi:MAG: amino acid permease [Candidatus Neomarinimicrobiota bacterium]
MEESKRLLGPVSATSIVVASMIGTGIFTTSGFLVENIPSAPLLLGVWIVGGLIALCGALTYSELAAAMPENGGEYNFLSKLFNPGLGFLSGWISLIVGFSAPIAGAAMAFGAYMSAALPQVPQKGAAVGVLLIFSFLHMAGLRTGTFTQNVLTFFKIGLILAFIIAGFSVGTLTEINRMDFQINPGQYFSPAFAVSLIFVMYAFSGWNAAAYIGGEVRNPGRNLPLALIIGTALVTLLYLGLNVLYICAVPLKSMAGVLEVGYLAAVSLFGESIGRLFSLGIAVTLLSMISAMVMAGPRVYQAMGRDIPFFRFLSRQSKRNTPINGIILQTIIALIILTTMTFDTLMYYVGFTLSIFTGLTAAGVFVLRRRRLPSPYRTWGYPVIPGIFILLSIWMIMHTIIVRPLESSFGVFTIALGWLVYRLTRGVK